MGLLDFFRRGNSSRGDQQVVGLWTSRGVEIEIRSDGTMDYTSIESGKRQIMNLTYRIEPAVRSERRAYTILV